MSKRNSFTAQRDDITEPSAPNHDDAPPAIACTLEASDFRQRVTDIRELARRSLRISERDGSSLYLTYDHNALSEVEQLVAKESECCAFLDFSLNHDTSGVQLTITAPESVTEAADALFAHFAPDLAQQVS